MAIKNVDGRYVQKHDVEANWLKATGFTPMLGELIVYDPDNTYDRPRFKVGDGETNVNALPFVGDPGVYLGDEEPSNPDVWLWINTDSDDTYASGAVQIDATLKVAGAAADAKAVGDKIAELIAEIEQLKTLLPA